MPLTVLSVAFPYAPVRDDVAGGAEQVLLALDRALVNAGHKSVVVAVNGSAVQGELRVGDAKDYRPAIANAIQATQPDLVHYHGLDFRDYLVDCRVPTLVTLHMPAEFYRGELPRRPGLFYHCVSASQQRRFPDRTAFLETIENGVDVEFFRPKHGRHKQVPYVVSLGRICSEKGFHLALDAARQAGIPMFLAGETFPYPDHQRYFQQEIAPRLDRARRWVGAVGRWRKRSLLSGARCLIVPSLVNETSSLVAMEALACGTPVIARPAGALPDIVEHGRTGWLTETSTEIAMAIRDCDHLNRSECRRAAETRFNHTRVAGEYFDLYRRLAHHTRVEVACSK